MVDRNGRQVRLCSKVLLWSKRVPKLDFDFAFLDEDTVEPTTPEEVKKKKK